MKVRNSVVLLAFVVPVIGALKTKPVDSKFEPAAFISSPYCHQTTRPLKCSGGSAICSVGGVIYYGDMACTSADTYKP
jgi:hypothetical protein